MNDPENESRGEREPTTAERFALADVRQMEAKWNGLVDRVKAIPGVDPRQIAIAVTEAEGAYMRLVRAIIRPERVTDDAATYGAPAGSSLVEAMRDPAFVAALENGEGITSYDSSTGLLRTADVVIDSLNTASEAFVVSIGRRSGSYRVVAGPIAIGSQTLSDEQIATAVRTVA